MQCNLTYINLYWPNTTKYQTVPPFTDPLPLITDQVPPITNQYCPVEKLIDTVREWVLNHKKSLIPGLNKSLNIGLEEV